MSLVSSRTAQGACCVDHGEELAPIRRARAGERSLCERAGLRELLLPAAGAAITVGAIYLIWKAVADDEGEDEGNKRHTPDQEAVVELAKEAARTGVTAAEAEALIDLAKEAGLPTRGPEAHPGRPFDTPHIHIGPINHIPVKY